MFGSSLVTAARHTGRALAAVGTQLAAKRPGRSVAMLAMIISVSVSVSVSVALAIGLAFGLGAAGLLAQPVVDINIDVTVFRRHVEEPSNELSAKGWKVELGEANSESC